MVTPTECLHYSMSLPVSTVITGCDTLGILMQGINAAMRFEPLTEEVNQGFRFGEQPERAAVLGRRMGNSSGNRSGNRGGCGSCFSFPLASYRGFA